MSPRKTDAAPRKRGSFFLVSLGCPKNLVDTEVIAGTLLSNRYTLTFDPDEADLYLVNTCAFIPAARREALDAVAEGAAWKRERDGRMLIVSGCLPQWDADGAVRKQYPEVDLWTGVNQVAEIAALLDAGARGSCDLGNPCYLYDETTPRLQLTLPHLAYLKIADGCSNRCTYCSIPNIRGALRSRPAASVVAEAKNLIAGGVRELLLIAQDITAYGTDRPESGETLASLLRELTAVEGDFVLRLLYTHPAHYTEELIELLAEGNPKLPPYLDIPLQHISDRILAAMHRHVTRRETEALLKKLRAAVPDLVLRTTFITGFPGETEEEFAELQAFLEEYKFERCGVFPYAPEPRTAAASLPGQVPPETAERRAELLMKQQRAIMRRANRRMVGRELRVLIDEVSGTTASGRSWQDAPEIDNTITIRGADRFNPGEFRMVRITAAGSYGMTGEPVQPQRRKSK